MTLSALLHSVTFDEIMPFIGKYHGDEHCMAGYKIHYDIVLGIAPQPDEDCSHTVTISYYEAGELEKNLPAGLLDAHPLEGDLWQVSLAKELIIAPDVTASSAEIAACCLYHTSFYGFTPDDLHETFNEINGDDETEHALTAKRIKSLYGDQVPNKKQMSHGRDFHNALKRAMRFYRSYRVTKQDKKERDFLSEGKRNWRKWKRCLITERYNATISMIGGFIEDMQGGESITAPPDINLLAELFTAKRCNIKAYRTYINDVSRRFENFKCLILKYGAFKGARLPNCILSISSSRDYPITMEEMQLIEYVAKGCEHIIFCVKVDDSLGKEIELKAAFYEL